MFEALKWPKPRKTGYPFPGGNQRPDSSLWFSRNLTMVEQKSLATFMIGPWSANQACKTISARLATFLLDGNRTKGLPMC